MKKRSCGEDVDVQAEKTIARQINAAVDSTNGTSFRKESILKYRRFGSGWRRQHREGVGRGYYVHKLVV